MAKWNWNLTIWNLMAEIWKTLHWGYLCFSPESVIQGMSLHLGGEHEFPALLVVNVDLSL